ncbi:MAG: hypothetical protein K1X81_03505 [Bacteroidia bacterium]|nr:hypothetical protein [Bacteroidia bacterium]
MELRILPECYANTALTTVLGFRKANHKEGVGNILKALDSPGYNNSIGIALIDKDKQAPNRLKEDYQFYKRIGSLEIRRMGQSKRFVIIHPIFEKWTYDEGLIHNISTGEFGLPNDYSAYKDVCKRQDASVNFHLKAYLNSLLQIDSEIKELKQIIDQLIKEFP